MSQARGKKILHLLDRYLGIPIVYFLGFLHKKKKQPQEIKKIAIFLFGAIGDSIIASSTINDLQNHYKQVRITVFITQDNAGIFSLFAPPYDTEILPLASPISAIRQIRKSNYDVLLDYNQWIRLSAIFSFFCKAKYKIGFATPAQFRHYVYDLAIEHSNVVHEIENYRNLVATLGVSERSKTKIMVSNEAYAKIKSLHLSNYVIFHLRASGVKSALKCWAIEKWFDLVKYVMERGYTVILTGGESDIALVDELMVKVGDDKIRSFAGKLTLMETAALLSGAKLLVTVNTGIMHLGAALHVKMVVLNGPVNINRWGPIADGNDATIVFPFGVSHGYISLGFEDDPEETKCMDFISSNAVRAAVEKYL